MIQIIKNGKAGNLMIGTCDNCECQIECNARDTQIASRGQDMQMVRRVECPECGNQIYVKEKE